MRRKLVVSFTGALKAIVGGRLSAADLTSALFYLGCARRHAFDPAGSKSRNELTMIRDVAERERIHTLLLNAFLQAEKEERILWRSEQDGNSYHELNQLLVRNGFPRLRFEPWMRYDYKHIEDAAKAQGAPYDVVWR